MQVKTLKNVLTYTLKCNNHIIRNLPIYLRITNDGKRVEPAIKRESHPEKCNFSAGRRSGNKEEGRL